MKWLPVVLLIIAIIVLLPFGLIWAVNTLFDVQNPYNFTHWLAALVFSALVAGGSRSSSRR